MLYASWLRFMFFSVKAWVTYEAVQMFRFNFQCSCKLVEGGTDKFFVSILYYFLMMRTIRAGQASSEIVCITPTVHP